MEFIHQGGDFGLHKKTIGLHRSFAAVHPLILQVRHLSLNAEVLTAHVGVAAAPFGVVANELTRMAGGLEELVFEIEDVFREMVDVLASWMKAQNRVRILQDSLDRCKSVGSLGEKAPEALKDNEKKWGSALTPGVGTVWEKLRREYEQGATEDLLLRAMIGQRKVILRLLKRLNELSMNVNTLTERINRVAVRQSHFTAISAMIEAARLDGNGVKLGYVAMGMQKMAGEIATIENTAKERILSLLGEARAIMTPLSAEIHDAAWEEAS